ncbi:Edem1 [Drosophila busckii]|uniref:alpha-1,2-Mannosidase n=1 Tax=Drosophila busckii TaxID=30019 RepID=A0A0M3QZI7_DROBS|nr:ER degradation-enhancing alpha-mannosidase-like protein 2 [Drosophila busckii]ALC49449.1 Edem1 [Drosophila busckii]
MPNIWENVYVIVAAIMVLSLADQGISHKHYTRTRKLELREDVRRMFQHAYDGYLTYAGNYDELRPLTCDGHDTWGSYSLTLIDALDTLATMGNYTEFRRVYTLLTEKMDFNKDINVSVFETNIRIVGGLLSAHLLSRRCGVEVEPGWPCSGPLLRMAEDVAKRLLPAFDTNTGMPYGTVNLRYGVPSGETSVTCTAGVGTFLIEFGTLSRLTGNTIYEEVALQAIYALWERRSSIGLFGNHIDVQSGRWTALDSGIGAGVDSLFEYLVKGAILLNRPELMELFGEARAPIEKYMRKDHWYVWVGMNKGHVTLPVFQSLESFWPGILSIVGDTEPAVRTMSRYISVWKKYGFLPEFFNIPVGEAAPNREIYPLRPELIESAMYLYRATKSEHLLELGEHMLETIEFSAKTKCGYATIRNVVTHEKENRMESFFLAETTKYLYLLFDEDNFLHHAGDPNQGELLGNDSDVCVVQAGAYVFNTEAHPMDMSAIHCCHQHKQDVYAQLDLPSFSQKSLFERQRQKRLAVQDKWTPKCQSQSQSISAKETLETPVKQSQTTMAVDIEVFDEFQQPAAEMLVGNFERIREERELNLSQPLSYRARQPLHRNQLTLIDLEDFFAQRREDFDNAADTLDYVLKFMRNYTMDVAFIRGMQLYDGNMTQLLGAGAQQDYEARMRTLWQLYELEQQFVINIRLMERLQLLTYQAESSDMHRFLSHILHALDELSMGMLRNETELGNQTMRHLLQQTRYDYERSLLNTTAMQEFVERIYRLGSNETKRKLQLQPLLSAAEMMQLEAETELAPAQLHQLFKYTRRMVEFRKRMAETVDRLQSIVQGLSTPATTPQPQPTASPLASMPMQEQDQQQQQSKPLQQQKQQQLMVTPPADAGSVWSQFVQNILRKTTTQRIKFDEALLLEKTRKSLEKHAHKQLDYELFSCRRPGFIENFAYREYYPEPL